MKTKLKTAIFAAVLGLASAVTSQAGYVFVGSWDLATLGGAYGNPSNPYLWTNNPAVYNGVEAAAHLFGGDASDYAISTIDADVANINHLAFVDGWADSQYLFNPASELFSLDMGNPGYNDPAGYASAYSALVVDHAPGYGAGRFVNYAFRQVREVPDHAWTVGLLGFALSGLAVMRRKLNLA